MKKKSIFIITIIVLGIIIYNKEQLHIVTQSSIMGELFRLPQNSNSNDFKLALLIAESNIDDATKCGEKDIEEMASLCNRMGYTNIQKLLLDKNKNFSTDSNYSLSNFIYNHYNSNIKSMVLYYSGHADQTYDHQPFDEDDKKDEYLNLAGEKLIDDRIKLILEDIMQETEIIFITDCCYSNNVHRIDPIDPKEFILNETSRDNLLHIGSIGNRTKTLCLDQNKSSIFTRNLIDLIYRRQTVTFKDLCDKVQLIFGECNSFNNVSTSINNKKILL